MPRHLLFGHGFDAHDTSAVSGDAFMSVSQVAHSKSGVKMDSIIQGSKGTSSLGPRAPKTRTERSRMRAKMLAAGIDSTDPRGAQGSSNPKPTPVAFSGGGTYTTMNQLTQKPMQKAARLSRAAGRSLHLPDEVEHKPKVTAFTRSFGNRTAQVLMRR
ncbi:unnamed protein product [Symbiodinium sp. KB8]|nr:unnamed protein product [Symbiodinium sp. KB8]